jgi:hypothetical protein
MANPNSRIFTLKGLPTERDATRRQAISFRNLLADVFDETPILRIMDRINCHVSVNRWLGGDSELRPHQSPFNHPDSVRHLRMSMFATIDGLETRPVRRVDV